MKKLLIALCLVCLTSFTPEKTLKIELTVQQYQMLIHVIDESKAEHATMVKPLFLLIDRQVKQQIDSTGQIK